MLLEWSEAIVTKIIDETANTKRFFFAVHSVSEFNFKPGQFVTLDLPIHEKRNKRWRSYSIASAPAGDNCFELVIVLLEGGLGTSYLFEKVNVGDTLLFRGPQGVFTLPPAIHSDLYLICTGTGVAPFRSMIHHIQKEAIPHHQIHLIFGCRKYTDCLYGHELKQFENTLSNFHYHPSFSRETNLVEGAHLGYVHPIYKKLLAEAKNTSANFYICGWKEMVDETRTTLAALGIPKENIHFELYG